MYISASDFCEKTINTYLKIEICVVCTEYVFIAFFETNQMIIYICTSEILKTRVKNQFLLHNIHLYLCGQVENTKWILNADLRFLIYKNI